MVISIELVDNYIRTFIDFWRLRPRKFYLSVTKTPKKYLTAPQFLAASLALEFVLFVAALGLVSTVLKQTNTQGVTGESKDIAIQFIVFLVANLLFGSLCFRAISRIWPVRGKAAFLEIFGLQCYMMAIIVPVSGLDLLIGPTITKLVSTGILPAWCQLIQLVIGLMVGFAGLFFWQYPGVAYLNGVSTGRLWFGSLFWSFILGIPVGVVIIMIFR